MDIFQMIIQGGSFALIAYIFVYIVPKLLDKANAELAANREATKELSDNARGAAKELSDSSAKLIKDLTKESREAIEKLVDRFTVEREIDRTSRHAMNTTFAETLSKVLAENQKMAEKMEVAIAKQTDKLEAKLDSLIVGVMTTERQKEKEAHE